MPNLSYRLWPEWANFGPYKSQVGRKMLSLFWRKKFLKKDLGSKNICEKICYVERNPTLCAKRSSARINKKLHHSYNMWMNISLASWSTKLSPTHDKLYRVASCVLNNFKWAWGLRPAPTISVKACLGLKLLTSLASVAYTAVNTLQVRLLKWIGSVV